MKLKNYTSSVDTALANLILDYIKDVSSAKAIVTSQEQFSFSSPRTTNSRDNKKLSIFLYSITERTSSKNTFPSENRSEKLEFHTSFTLHYLITPFTGNEKDDHTLLEEIMQMFLAKPIIGIVYAESNIELAVRIDSLSLDELSRLWMALDAPLSPSVFITVSSTELLHNPQTEMPDAVVAVSQTQELDTNHVTQLYKSVLKTYNGQFNSWRNRNMVVKQWVLQDFQKNTGMAADEMQVMLNNLGDKLEHGESTTQFLKPLNQLALYYQHQLDELKGLHKISHKQTENIESIITWIRDIKTLIAALGS